MNIVIATPEFVTENNAGGYGRYVENLSRILADHYHCVYIITLSDQEGIIEWQEGITVYRVVCPKNPEKKGLLSFPLFYWIGKHIWWKIRRSYVIKKKIEEINKTVKIDIVQTAAIQGINILRNKTIPTIVRIAGNPILFDYALEYDYDYNKARKKRAELTYELSLRALKKADYVFSSSRFAAKEISERYGAKIDIIESPFLNNVSPDFELYNKYLLDKEYFLFFATLNFLKGIRAIAECLDDFLSTNPTIFFVFCGSDSKVTIHGNKMSARDFIRSNCTKHKDRIIFLDKITDKAKLFGVVKNAKACVMPSRVDNLPNACIEAMSLGKIVIGTRGASYEQMIIDGENGFLCEIDDSSGLLEKMNSIMNMNLTDRERIEQKARLAVQRMNPDIIYDIIISLYNSLIEKFERHK